MSNSLNHGIFTVKYRLKSSDSTIKPSERLIVAGDKIQAKRVFSKLPIGRKSVVLSVN